jgi:hypothetical protein
MTTKARVGTRSGVPVVSLTNPKTVQIFFESLGHTSKERRELRGDIFKQISRNTKLQDELLSVVAKHPQRSAEFCWNSREISNFANGC